MNLIDVNDKKFILIEIEQKFYDFSSRRNNEIIYLLKDVINPLTGSEKSEITDLPFKYGFVIRDHKIIGKLSDLIQSKELLKIFNIDSDSELDLKLKKLDILSKLMVPQYLLEEIKQRSKSRQIIPNGYSRSLSWWRKKLYQYNKLPYDYLLIECLSEPAIERLEMLNVKF